MASGWVMLVYIDSVSRLTRVCVAGEDQFLESPDDVSGVGHIGGHPPGMGFKATLLPFHCSSL